MTCGTGAGSVAIHKIRSVFSGGWWQEINLLRSSSAVNGVIFRRWMMAEQERDDVVALVASDCDAAQVQGAYSRLLNLVCEVTPDAPVRLELTGSRPTAFALQLLLAAAKSLDRRGALAGFGPIARTALSLNG